MATAAPFDEVKTLAERMGLTLAVTSDERGIRAVISRDTGNPQDWSLAETTIAIGRSPLVVASSAIGKLREMAPRLQRKLDELESPVEEEYVRLHPDDIEALAEAIARHARENAGER